MSRNFAPAISLAARRAQKAGEAVARDMLCDATEVELREQIPEPLRAGGPSSAPAGSPGCPCGCGDSELLLRARSGDDGAMSELIGRYRKLARSKARSYFLVGADREDVVQEGMIGIYKAIRDYDESLGVPFRGFAEICVTRQVISAVKAATRLKHTPLSQAVSLDKPVGADEEGSTLRDLLPAANSADPASAAVSADQIRALQRHFDEALSDLEQQVLRHHIEGKSYDEIAAMLQRHAKSVDNALQRIKRKLQGHLDERQAADAG